METVTTLPVDEEMRSLIAKLKAKQDTLDIGACKTDNDRAACYALRVDVQRVISQLQNRHDDVDPLEQLLTDLEARRAAVIDKREEIEQALAAVPDWRQLGDDHRVRDAAFDQEKELRLQMRLLSAGKLWSGPGSVYERLEDLDRRIATVTAELREQRLRLASAVRHGGELLREPAKS